MQWKILNSTTYLRLRVFGVSISFVKKSYLSRVLLKISFIALTFWTEEYVVGNAKPTQRFVKRIENLSRTVATCCGPLLPSSWKNKVATWHLILAVSSNFLIPITSSYLLQERMRVNSELYDVDSEKLRKMRLLLVNTYPFFFSSSSLCYARNK